MEFVSFEYVLFFELERPTSAKNVEMQFFADKIKITCSFIYGYNKQIFMWWFQI